MLLMSKSHYGHHESSWCKKLKGAIFVLEYDKFLPRDSYAKRGICRRRVSVCVCLSHSGIVSKRLNVGSRKQRRTIAPWL